MTEVPTIIRAAGARGPGEECYRRVRDDRRLILFFTPFCEQSCARYFASAFQLVLGEESGTFGQGAPKSRNGPFYSPSKIGRAHQLLGRRNGNSNNSNSINNDAPFAEGDRQLKRTASTKIAAKMTVSNAFRRRVYQMGMDL